MEFDKHNLNEDSNNVRQRMLSGSDQNCNIKDEKKALNGSRDGTSTHNGTLNGSAWIDSDVADASGNLLKRQVNPNWKCCNFKQLPFWLQDNDFLLNGHRPELPDIPICLKSILRIHTETGNIWTHMLGCFGFICIAVNFLSRPQSHVEFTLEDKIVYGLFFAGAIFCLGFSFVFHTLCCHSPKMSKLFSKLDYCGISLLTTFSCVIWLYYGFRCYPKIKTFYIAMVCIFGLITFLISLIDKFSQPNWRTFRTGVFMTFGLSSVLPAIHYACLLGWWLDDVSIRSLVHLLLMAGFYLVGATLYAMRIPERFYPGKFDLVLHSHQIFHVFVICAALVHFKGITELAIQRLTQHTCAI